MHRRPPWRASRPRPGRAALRRSMSSLLKYGGGSVLSRAPPRPTHRLLCSRNLLICVGEFKSTGVTVPQQHEAPAAQRPGPAQGCSVSGTRTCGHGVSRLRPQILLGAIRLDLAVHEEPADGGQCDQEKLLHRATSSFLDVGDFCRPTIHTDRYRSVICLRPGRFPDKSDHPSLLRTGPSSPVAPYEWCSSEDRWIHGVGHRNREPHPHHQKGKQTGPPESEGP